MTSTIKKVTAHQKPLFVCPQVNNLFSFRAVMEVIYYHVAFEVF